MMFIKELLSPYLLLKPGFSEKKKDDQLMRSWSAAAILTESKVSNSVVASKYIFQRVGLRKKNEIPLFRNWFPSVIWDMICIRKFSISRHCQYEIYTDFADKDFMISALIIKYSIIKFITTMNK